MEGLVSTYSAPANAETADVETTNADAEVKTTNGEGPAPSGAEAATPETETAKRDKVQERIDKLTRDKYDALRERDMDRYELERLRQQAQVQAPTTQVAPDTFPTLEQHGYDESKYQAAVAKFYEDAAEKAVDRKLTKHQQETQEQTRNKRWSDAQAEFVKSKPDYVDKVLNAPYLPISHELQQALKELPNGPQLAYHLVENGDAARAIMALSLPLQLMEVGRITARLEAAKAVPKPPVSQAPSPVPKVEHESSAVSKAWNDPTLSQDEFNKRRKQQIAKRK